MSRAYAPGLRRRVIDLIESGRSVAVGAAMVAPAEQTLNCGTGAHPSSHRSRGASAWIPTGFPLELSWWWPVVVVGRPEIRRFSVPGTHVA
jgi:hypothetical protein